MNLSGCSHCVIHKNPYSTKDPLPLVINIHYYVNGLIVLQGFYISDPHSMTVTPLPRHEGRRIRSCLCFIQIRQLSRPVCCRVVGCSRAIVSSKCCYTAHNGGSPTECIQHTVCTVYVSHICAERWVTCPRSYCLQC